MREINTSNFPVRIPTTIEHCSLRNQWIEESLTFPTFRVHSGSTGALPFNSKVFTDSEERQACTMSTCMGIKLVTKKLVIINFALPRQSWSAQASICFKSWNWRFQENGKPRRQKVTVPWRSESWKNRISSTFTPPRDLLAGPCPPWPTTGGWPCLSSVLSLSAFPPGTGSVFTSCLWHLRVFLAGGESSVLSVSFDALEAKGKNGQRSKTKNECTVNIILLWKAPPF